MDRKEKPRSERRSDFANKTDAGRYEAVPLASATGREFPLGAEPGTVAAVDVAQPVGTVPRSQVTGRHDSGSGANETVDGLSSIENAAREAAEDVPPGPSDDQDEVPVFERRQDVPRV